MFLKFIVVASCLGEGLLNTTILLILENFVCGMQPHEHMATM